MGAECIIAPTPDILLVQTGGTGLTVRNRYCLLHQRKVAGLQFLGLPLQNKCLKDTLQTPSSRCKTSGGLFSGEISLALRPSHFLSK